MEIVLEAIYEDGVFKPLKKINLKEGEKVMLLVKKPTEKILEIIKSFRKKLELKKIKEDPLKVLLEMRDR